MTSSNWLALFILGVVGVTVYGILTRPDITPEDFEFLDEEWWG